MDPQFTSHEALIAAVKLSNLGTPLWFWADSDAEWVRAYDGTKSFPITVFLHYNPDEFAIQDEQPQWTPLSARARL